MKTETWHALIFPNGASGVFPPGSLRTPPPDEWMIGRQPGVIRQIRGWPTDACIHGVPLLCGCPECSAA